MKRSVVLLTVLWAGVTRADGLPSLAGPAMGTTYRVTLAADIPGMSRGEVHREVERVLARIDRAASTWRDDSDVSRFNRAGMGEWIEVAEDLVAIVEVARAVHGESGGAFDITFVPPGAGRPMGMQHVVSRQTPPALMKRIDGIAIDLGGIGPGYAVDCIGDRIRELGSTNHLVELGGEVRAWGTRPDGSPWRVFLRASDGGHESADRVELASGEAVATSSVRPGRSPIDPRTGRLVATKAATISVRAETCALADARALAALVKSGEND